MVGKLLILFIVVPIIELVLLIEIGRIIGTFYTIGLIFATGIIGVFLAKTQGFLVLRNIRLSLARGEMPGQHLIDGLLIFAGGMALLTPGLLTDLLGLSLLFPVTRGFYRNLLIKKLKYWLTTGQIKIFIP
ncbi:MAG: FxsA family protein [Clostridia bacterium]|jgi:UPF0716 protein FxsA|nr:FxsA family protein [Clostridia bacterium]